MDGNQVASGHTTRRELNPEIKMKNKIHSFDTCVSSSWAASDLPLWGDCYRQFFGLDCTLVDHRADGPHQRAGIDRSVIMSDSKQILIDEKIRWVDYGDIALEEWSKESMIPGWITKPLRCDYIAYAIAPAGKCYLLPVIQLQKAWRKNNEQWKINYDAIRARNETYTSISWPIPVDKLMLSIAAVSIATFNPISKN